MAWRGRAGHLGQVPVPPRPIGAGAGAGAAAADGRLRVVLAGPARVERLPPPVPDDADALEPLDARGAQLAFAVEQPLLLLPRA